MKPSDLFTSPEGQEKLRQFFILLGLILIIFLAIEIAPLHFGPKHLPWNALLPEIKQRLPRILLIGIAASVFIVSSKKKNGDEKKDRN